MVSFTTVYCIDGSGNKNVIQANKKRPIYEIDVQTNTISRRKLLAKQSTFEFFDQAIQKSKEDGTILICADVPIGLPAEPSDVYNAIGTNRFLDWLESTDARLGTNSWRTEMIATRPEDRTAYKPFVSIKKRSAIGDFAGMRLCDRQTNGASVYCVDQGPKQVGKAALQFWFEVLMPLRKKYKDEIAVWPFEEAERKKIVIAECYPALCQKLVYKRSIRKQNSADILAALLALEQNQDAKLGIGRETWDCAGSSEDEFDMFTTAFAIREILKTNVDLLKSPDDGHCKTLEGWMLGLVMSDVTVPTQQGPPLSSKNASAKVGIGSRNRNEQENLGRSGNKGPKGPLHNMKCHRQTPNGAACGNLYETNAQDVFHKKCPKCQSKKA